MEQEKVFKIFFNHTCCAGVGYYRMISFAEYIQKAKNVSLAYSKFSPNMSDVCEWEQMLESKHENTGQIIKDLDNLMKIADITVWQVMHTMRSISLFRAYRDMYDKKTPILMEVDDDLFNVNPENLGFDGYNPNSDMEYFAEMQMRNANALIVSTEYLKQRLSKYNPCIEVVPNGIDFELWDRLKNRRSHKNIRIGWTGSHAHLGKNLNIVMRVIPKILEKYKDVEFIFMGDKPLDMPVSNRVIHHTGCKSIFEYPSHLAKMGFDIGLAPLRDNLFNRAKSNLRWLEYSALKIPTVASNVEPFKKSITNEHDGILVEYDTDDWVQALSTLIENKEMREHLGMNAYYSVKEAFNTEKIAKNYLGILKDFVNGKKKINAVQYDEISGEGVYKAMI